MERTFELIRQSQAGEKQAKEQLITMHSGLIWNVVRRFKGRGVELEDLYQIGAIGLIRAIDKFDFNSTDSSIISKFIDMHDIFMSIRLKNDNNPYHHVLTEEYINTQINELNSVGNGEQLLKYLIMVGRADNLAQNPEMTGDSLHLLTVFDSMLDNMISKEL